MPLLDMNEALHFMCLIVAKTRQKIAYLCLTFLFHWSVLLFLLWKKTAWKRQINQDGGKEKTMLSEFFLYHDDDWRWIREGVQLWATRGLLRDLFNLYLQPTNEIKIVFTTIPFSLWKGKQTMATEKFEEKSASTTIHNTNSSVISYG